MKNINYTLILSILLFGLQNRLLGQTRPEEQKVSLTPGGIFDEVADRFGNRYQLSEISIYSTKTFGNASINSLPTQSCNAGYFRLFFAPGSQFSQNATARAVLCGVFSDISSFIISPLSSSTVMVNVFCDDVPPSASQLGVLGSASDVSMFAPFPTNTNQGIVNSAVRYTIQSGQDIFSTFPVSLYSQANAYYHAYVNANLSNITWNFSTTTPTITNTEFDFYSVMLHEVCHALGFYSMIDGSGFSKLGQNNNYFSLYDKFLFDANGNPLLAGPTLSCSNSNLTFQTATTTIAPGCNTATPSQTTNCSTGCKYIGNYSNTITVYTPDCFSSSSSLSHFEDMCTYPTSFTTSCVPTPTAPGYNNLYYVMSDGQSPGSCYIKRFLKEDERLVFCDLGYQVSDTYSISGTLVKTYSGGTCTPVSIIGTNDGFSNNVYSIVSTGTSQVVLYSALLSNDSPNTGLTVSCIEAVYSNATVTAGTSDMTVTAAPGAGLTIIKYYPRNSSGQLGNATYVFVYFASGTCSPPNTCNMIQNGSFESTSGQACGIIGPSTFTWNSQVSCWDAYFGTPDLYFRGCNTTPGQNLGTNVDGMIPALDSWNGAPNDHIIHFGITVLPPSIYGSESIYNNLSVALIPGQTYQLSMLVCNYAGPAIINYNPNSSSVVITAASDVSMPSPPLGIYPGNLNVLAEFTVPAVTTPSWTALTATFVFNPTNNLTHSVFHLGGDGLKTSLAGGIFPVIGAAKVYVDELSLIPIPTVTFNIPQNTLTVNNTLTNLAQYASSVPGSFSGAGVTVATGTAGTIYNFNTSQTLTPGNYPIAFTYTVNGCSNILWQTIKVSGINVVNFSPCISSYTLAANGFPTSTSYTWMPGGMTTQSVVVNPSVTTIYTLTAINGTATNIYTTSLAALTLTPITFTNLPTVVCSGGSDIILNNLLAPSTPTGGSWFAGGTYTTTSSGSVITVWPVSSGTLSAGQYYMMYSLPVPGVTVCFQSASFYVTLQPNSFTLSAAASTLCTNISSNVTASVISNPPSSALSYTWLPGNLSGFFQTLNPTATTIYSISATGGSCSSSSNTLAVTVSSNCCSNNLAAFTSTSISANTIFSSTNALAVINAFTIQPNTFLTLDASEFVMAPNAKITISGNATLNVLGSHLYACGNTMWQGIEVLDGGKLVLDRQTTLNKDNLIEDALKAVDVRAQSTSTINSIFKADHTIFNKNYMDISISAYQRSLTTYPFDIENCVFTCRSLPFTSNAWPNTNATSANNTFSANLRYATSASGVNGLLSPYLGQAGFNVVNLKQPYANQYSHIAIQINTVGLTSGNSFYSIKIGNTVSDLNLFDSHGRYIDAQNANLILVNNVFQNTMRYLVSNGTNTVYFGGEAVQQIVAGTGLFKLEAVTTSTSSGLRFWNCHTGIKGQNVYRFNIENALFRSTQSTASLPSGTFVPQGNAGIVLNTNRFQYYIKNNEFTNINDCINVPIAPAVISTPPLVFGVYAANIAVLQNTFAAASGTAIGTNYLNRALSITSALQVGQTGGQWHIAPDYTTSTLGTLGVRVEDNVVNNAYRGFYQFNVVGFSSHYKNNSITLAADATFGLAQHGIDLSNNTSSGNVPGQFVVAGNQLSGPGTNTATNQLSSHVYCSLNSGLASPSVCCNSSQNSWQGFVFSGPNTPTASLPGTRWLGNSMQNLNRGMVLTNAGSIGQQGNTQIGMANKWNGTWSNLVNYGIYTQNSSTAALSPLWALGNTAPSFPPNRDGIPNNTSYASNSVGTTTVSAEYSCNEPTAISVNNTNTANYSNSTQEYINNTALYRFLHLNDSVKNANADLLDFYDALNGTNIGLLALVEEKLYANQYDDALDILAGLSADNSVEQNHVDYYTLFAHYLQGLESGNGLSSGDKTDLLALAALCPEEDGACVLEARALCNTVFNTFLDYEDCGGEEARPGKQSESNPQKRMDNSEPEKLDFNIFPNPTGNQLTIVGQKNNQLLNITISDLSGRVVLERNFTTAQNLANLEIDLINGAYFVYVTGTKNEKYTKILFIAR